MEKPQTPELDKMLAEKEKSQVIGSFLDEVGEKGWALCEWTEDENSRSGGEYTQVRGGIETILAEYFGVDEEKAEKERIALLEYVRSQNK